MARKLYDKTMFERMDLQQISSFLLFGEECCQKDGTYEERLLDVEESVINALTDFRNQKIGYLNAEEELKEALSIQAEICTERGVKLGAKLMLQLLHGEDKSTP